MSESDLETLRAIRDTLKTLDVRGWESIDSLVGCVMTLNRMLEEENGEQINK